MLHAGTAHDWLTNHLQTAFVILDEVIKVVNRRGNSTIETSPYNVLTRIS